MNGGDHDGSEGSDERTRPDDDVGPRRFVPTEAEATLLLRDVVTVLAVVTVGLALLYGVSGTWPPLVAVESGSMEPNVETGDIVFIVDDERFVGEDPVDGTGVVTAAAGAQTGHETFGEPGDVVVFEPNGDPSETPIIHRAHFWVEEGEDWVETRSESAFLGGHDCHSLPSCPAPHDGFVTKGDDNPVYDQATGPTAETTVVDPAWITGKASTRLPWLGYVRLAVESVLGLTGPVADSAVRATHLGVGSAAGASVLGA